MKKIIYYFTLISCLLFQASCSSFLDVKPQDNILEDEVFSSVNGFNIALNGIYSEMNSSDVYGSNLTGGLVDVMAQYFYLENREHIYFPYASYDFANSQYMGKTEAIWKKMYSLIANSNAIIAKIDEKKSILGDPYYQIFKAESLAIRAFLHFDLLRLFGSTYSEDLDSKVIPYMKKADRSIEPLLSNKEIIQLVLADMTEAKELLKNSDPVLTKSRLNLDDPVSNMLNYRQYRLNYFAVCGLLARVSLWSGDKATAKSYAEEVLNLGQKPGNEIFPFVTDQAVNNSGEFPDRVFSTEVLFALYNTKRSNIHNSLYSYSLSPVQLLTFVGTLSEGRVPQLYPNENDYRRKLHWAQQVNSTSNEVLYFTKYADVTDTEGISIAYKNMFPLLRISEMYLILAETASNISEAERYYNILQVHRGLPEQTILNEADLEEKIQDEYLKEFIGEGQTYFYFKRLQKTAIPSPVRPGLDKFPMEKKYYLLPLPESETSLRN